MKTMIAAAAVAIAGVPAAATAQDFSGPRIEARLGYETPTISEDNEVYKIGSAVSYGAEAGFDIRSKGVVFGPFVNYEASGVSLCNTGGCLSEKGNLNAGVRIGGIVGESGLLYGKIGYASITFEARQGTVSASESKSGVQGALGYEHGFGKFYGFFEAGYADYGKFYGINLQRRQVAAGVGIRF